MKLIITLKTIIYEFLIHINFIILQYQIFLIIIHYIMDFSYIYTIEFFYHYFKYFLRIYIYL